MEQMKMAAQWLQKYTGEGLHFLLLFAALLYILFCERDRTVRRLIAGYALVFAAVYLCPLTAGLITRMIGDDVYWRMLWLLPSPVIMAYAMVRAWERSTKRWARLALPLVFACLICLTGKNVYLQDTPYERAANPQKIPSSPAAICDIINADREEGEHALVAAPADMVGYIRQYDGSIGQVYGRREVIAGGYGIRRVLTRSAIVSKRLCARARALGCNYLVVPRTAVSRKKMRENGFAVIGQVGSYTVFADRQ